MRGLSVHLPQEMLREGGDQMYLKIEHRGEEFFSCPCPRLNWK